MTKLSLELVDTGTLSVRTSCSQTAAVLGLSLNGPAVPIAPLLADQKELETLQETLSQLVNNEQQQSFATLELVFCAFNIEAATFQDRTVLQNVVFANPVRAMHICGTCHLACLVHLEKKQTPNNDSIHLTALEYSRDFRQHRIQQEFGSWLLQENVEMAVIATTIQGDVVFWNRFAERLYKYTADEALGHSIMELTPSELSQEQGLEILQRLSQGQHWRGMFKVKDKHARSFMAHVIDTPIMDENQQVKYIVGLSADYTLLHDTMEHLEKLNQNLNEEVQKRTADLLQREQTSRRIGAAVQQSDTGVLIAKSDDGRILWSNQAVCSMLDATDDTIVGTTVGALPLRAEKHHGSANGVKPPCLGELFHTILQSDDHDPAYFIPTNPNSTARVVEVTAQKLDDHEYLLTLRDLTPERSAADALLQAETAAATSQTKTHMMRMLSHDLRTPLQGIVGVASTMMVDLQPNTDVYDNIATILVSSRLLLTLIENVLDMGKIDEKMLESVSLTSLQIARPVRDSIAFCEPFANIHEVTIAASDFDHEDGFVVANYLRLEQILINLLSNAIKYCHTNTTVNVLCRWCKSEQVMMEAQSAAAADLYIEPTPTTKRFCVVTVQDHGPGIAEADCEKLFGEFIQLENAAKKDRQYKGGGGGQATGFGLGLSLARNFCRLMHGRIWFNNWEHGSEFSFALPAGDVPAMMDHSEHSGSPLQSADPTILSNLRVLVVDDSIVNQKVFKNILSRIGLDDIWTAANGQEALDVLEIIPLPHIMLIDLQMPVMDGFELLAILRERQTQSLCVSCTADWSRTADCVQAGFDRQLRKPIVFNDMLQFLSKLVIDDPERYKC